MAIQIELDKDGYEKLSDEFKKEYKKGDDDKYYLDAPGLEQVQGALKNSRKMEKKAQDELKQAKADLKKLKESGKSGDDDKSKELQSKLDEAEARVEAAQKKAIKKTIAAEAGRLIAGLTDNPRQAKMLQKAVEDNFVERVDDEGNLVLTDGLVEDTLRARLKKDYDFLCKPSGDGDSKGGGAAGNDDKTGGAGNKPDMTGWSPLQKLMYARTNKDNK